MRRLPRRWLYWVLVSTAVCGLGGSVFATVLRGGELAETVSAISAVLSALALIGVVVALYFQVQQTEIARVDALMNHRSELLMFAIERPELLVAWGIDNRVDGDTTAKLQAYASMVFNHMWASFELNRLTRDELRYTCDRIFQNDVIAEWWGDSRMIYHGYRSLPLGRRNFPELVDQAFHRSPFHIRSVSSPPTPRPAPTP